eukprot:6196824-Pleurochrysis_carterae.AAC.1
MGVPAVSRGRRTRKSGTERRARPPWPKVAQRPQVRQEGHRARRRRPDGSFGEVDSGVLRAQRAARQAPPPHAVSLYLLCPAQASRGAHGADRHLRRRGAPQASRASAHTAPATARRLRWRRRSPPPPARHCRHRYDKVCRPPSLLRARMRDERRILNLRSR